MSRRNSQRLQQAQEEDLKTKGNEEEFKVSTLSPSMMKIPYSMESKDEDGNPQISPIRSGSNTPTSIQTDYSLPVPNRPPPSFPPNSHFQSNGGDDEKYDNGEEEDDEEEMHVMPGPQLVLKNSGKPFEVHAAVVHAPIDDDHEQDIPGGLNESIRSNATSVSSYDGSITS